MTPSAPPSSVPHGCGGSGQPSVCVARLGAPFGAHPPSLPLPPRPALLGRRRRAASTPPRGRSAAVTPRPLVAATAALMPVLWPCAIDRRRPSRFGGQTPRSRVALRDRHRRRRRRVARTAPAQARCPRRGTPGGLSNLGAPPPPPTHSTRRGVRRRGPFAEPSGGLSERARQCRAAPVLVQDAVGADRPEHPHPSSFRSHLTVVWRCNPALPLPTDPRAGSERARRHWRLGRRRRPSPARCGVVHRCVESAVTLSARRGAPPSPPTLSPLLVRRRYHGGW